MGISAIAVKIQVTGVNRSKYIQWINGNRGKLLTRTNEKSLIVYVHFVIIYFERHDSNEFLIPNSRFTV